MDVMVMPDGALLVSDDKAGAVLRISYSGYNALAVIINTSKEAKE